MARSFACACVCARVRSLEVTSLKLAHELQQEQQEQPVSTLQPTRLSAAVCDAAGSAAASRAEEGVAAGAEESVAGRSAEEWAAGGGGAAAGRRSSSMQTGLKQVSV